MFKSACSNFAKHLSLFKAAYLQRSNGSPDGLEAMVDEELKRLSTAVLRLPGAQN